MKNNLAISDMLLKGRETVAEVKYLSGFQYFEKLKYLFKLSKDKHLESKIYFRFLRDEIRKKEVQFTKSSSTISIKNHS